MASSTRKLLTVLAVGLFVAVQAAAAQDNLPSFSAASVKPVPLPPGARKRGPVLTPGTATYAPPRFTANNMPLNFLMVLAYGVEVFQVTGGPDWVATERFDIEATAERTTTKEQMNLMLRSLLADRFHLKVRRESRESTVYWMFVPPRGLKFGPGFHPVTADEPKPQDESLPIEVIHNQFDMKALAQLLTYSSMEFEGIPVIDHTGLTGTYDVTLHKNADWLASVQSFGLKLEKKKVAVEYLAVEHVERPSLN